MSALLFDAASLGSVSDLELESSAPPARVLAGDPLTSEHVLHERDGLEVGVWEVTPGSFRSSKLGISEFMYFVTGSGTITWEDGSVANIAPGSFVSLPDGSEVVWEVTETCRKVYVIAETPEAA